MSASPEPFPIFAPDQVDFYLGDPHAAFARIRAEDPLHWYEGGGFWCATKLADVSAISRAPRTFSSAHGNMLFEVGLRRTSDVEISETPLGGTALAAGPQSIIRIDPPEHNRMRKLAIGAFTPKRIAAQHARIRELASESLADVEPGAIVDFVDRVAVPLPMLMIAELVGVPRSDHADFRRWSNAMIDAGGGDLSEGTAAVIAELFAYFAEKTAECRKKPRSDVLSQLATAEIDGERLDDGEIVMFAITLLVAGNETTRNLISGGMLALLEHPDQLALLRRDPTAIPNAVEEMLRWVTPVQNFVRRVMSDTEVRDKALREGDYVALLYGSANRDEEVFGPDANRFDVTRNDARRHISFGFGEHLCLGASLARLEACVMFEEILRTFGEIELAGEVERLPSSLMNGIERMPVVCRGLE